MLGDCGLGGQVLVGLAVPLGVSTTSWLPVTAGLSARPVARLACGAQECSARGWAVCVVVMVRLVGAVRVWSVWKGRAVAACRSAAYEKERLRRLQAFRGAGHLD